MVDLKKNPSGIELKSSDQENRSRNDLIDLLQNSKIPSEQILGNLGLFLDSKHLARILLMDHLFKLSVGVHGDVFEFGTRWGQNSSLFSALRGIYEPFNRHKKIVVFDTFEGFPNVHSKDGGHQMMFKGALRTHENYEKFLEKILNTQEKLNPLSHIKKYEIVKGDAIKTFPEYLNQNPHTIVSLVFLDFDIYEPTKEILKIIKPRLVKGSVVAFDELNDPDSPGETLALMETIGLNNVELKKFPYASRVSYFIVR
tara:strand:+ start:1503 stop:2270 length:768 start_codon:yes stop_codon:yes gene_type:complete